MKRTLTVACIPSKSAWQAVCLPFLMLLRRLSPLRCGSLRSALTALLLAQLAAVHAMELSAPQFVDVFVSGQDGYPNYRIPSLVVAGKGTLLALCEGRTKNDDHAANDLVPKRSGDGGKSWSPLQLVRDEGEATCNDPMMTVLDSGRVLIPMWQRVSEGEKVETFAFVAISDDGGRHPMPNSKTARCV